MSRLLKLTLKIGGVLLSLALILWMVVAGYVYSHKEELLLTITKQLNEDINGQLTIEKMEPALIRGFPGISVSLENVLLRDSLWSIHKHDLLQADKVYIAINAFSILSGSPTIKDIRINDGKIYLFTDTNGVRNTDIFRKKPASSKGGGNSSKRINRVYLKNVYLTVDDKQRDKLLIFNINNFNGNLNYNSLGWKGRVNMKARVESFAFKVARGSFMKNMELDADLDLIYLDKEHQLRIPLQEVTIGRDDLEVGGVFHFAPDFSDYKIDIKAESIEFKNATALLSTHISSRLKPYSVKSPVDIQASIEGKLKGGGEPLINASWTAKDNTISSAGETITDCSFTGIYSNELVKGKKRNDPNSVIAFYNMSGKYYDIPFKSDSIQIADLKDPVFTGKFKADFQLSKLNKIFGGTTFLFNGGTAELNLLYKAPFNQDDKGQRFIYGTVHVHDAKAIYKPRNLALKDMHLVMNFKGNDLFLDNIKVKSGNTTLAMQGTLRNFSNLYYTDPEKMLVNWQIKSPEINLNEFMVFLGKRKSYTTSTGDNRAVAKMSAQLDKVLEQASMKMNVNVDRLIYKKFVATQVRSEITLKRAGIAINNLSLNQGGGNLNITGNIDQSGKINRFNVDTKIRNVNVEKLFYAFENFGQDAITDKNLRGSFFGGTSVSGSMTDNGKIVPRSFKGSVDFDIRNGALLNFEPMTRAGAFAFPNRNFSDIRFSNLKNTLHIQGSKILIPPMEIRSSVLNIFLEGVYSFDRGTNIALKIPLRNPEKDEVIINTDLKNNRDLKGIVINLRALDGEDGKVRFRLGKKTPDGYQ